MVLFLDLDEPQTRPAPTPAAEKPNMNRAHPFSAVLMLYPFLAGLASHLDRTDLHNLASTCNHFHATLTAYRSTLLSGSLQCRYPNDKLPKRRLWADIACPKRCPRDLVQGCVRCDKPICRNCIQKPHPIHFNDRFRRLCRPCQRDPNLLPPKELPPFEAVRRVCLCADGPWICPPCFNEMAPEDNAYRLWREIWGDEFSRETTRMVRSGAGGQFVPATGRSQGWGPVLCARGRECSGLVGTPQVEDVPAAETPGEERSESGWLELAAAFEEHGDDSWEAQEVEPKIPRKRRLGGRPVDFGRGWALVEEWHGDARGFCNWCDKIVLSKVDKANCGLQ